MCAQFLADGQIKSEKFGKNNRPIGEIVDFFERITNVSDFAPGHHLKHHPHEHRFRLQRRNTSTPESAATVCK